MYRLHTPARAVLAFAAFAAFLLLSPRAFAADLILDGNVAGPAVCPDGGTPVDTTCQVNATAGQNRGCRYGGVKTFGVVSLTNNALVCTTAYNGDRVNTGQLVIKADVITVDATSRIFAKGTGYRGVDCGDGEGPATAPLSGGRGGCSVLDSGGGGAHFGNGGRGTKDCQSFGDANTCQFPQEWEEDCGNLNAAGTACVTTTEPGFPTCRGTANPATGAGNALPTVAGGAFRHSIYDIEFGAAGGDKGCADGFEPGLRAGRGGGRIVLFAANGAQTGMISIAGRVSADGHRGCAVGNDSAGGGAGGGVLIIADQVSIAASARVSARGGRGGDSQPKCLPCTANNQCESGQTCQAGRCGPCNCTPCSNNSQCNALLGQTCKNLGGNLGSVCANSSNQCTPFDPTDNEIECRATQNNGTCDDCAGGGGGGIINVQSRVGNIHPQAIFDVRGGVGGICPICSGEAGGGTGELQIDSGYVGEICDGYDNDFDGQVDEDLGMITCPDGTMIASCVGGEPQLCAFDPAVCGVPAEDARPRFAMIVDTSGSMLNDLQGTPTFGDGSVDFPGVDTASDPDTIPGNNSRLFIAKEALSQVLSAFPESDFALARYYQDVGVNRSCQSAANFECAKSCCSYDDPSNNTTPLYPALYPDNQCVLAQLYPGAGFPASGTFTSNMPIGWLPEAAENPPTSDCINYAGSCGPPRRGSQFLVGFNEPINRYLSWLDGTEDEDAQFDSGTLEGNHCPNGDCELRGSGPTPLAGALEATHDYLTPIVTCDAVSACRSYAAILLTDGAESCGGNAVQAASELLSGINGKPVPTYVIGFSVLPAEQTQLNQIAQAGGTQQAFFASSKSELADALAEIIGQNQRFEMCNDLDDDCDTLVDEDFPEKGLVCTDGELGACLGVGTYVCKADGTGTECVLTDPGASPSPEVCNGIDDDCDGLIDEDDAGLPLDCPTCTPSPEICDGIDNDCDLSIDEEPDVSQNQPTIYGQDCQPPTAPNDQLPCRPGTVLCINAGPVCVGAVGPQAELCNGQDDDCDGLADNEAPCPGASQCVSGQCAIPCDAGEFACPPGLLCKEGFCLKATCDDITCPSGQVCEEGVCVDPSGTGGGSASGGGTGGTGGTGGDTSSTSTTTPSGGGETPPRGVYGQAVGGGGCATAPTGARSTASGGWLIVAAACAAATALRRRAARRAPRRAPRSACASSTTLATARADKEAA
ncbi:vWA domain-containing protein [Chondromyces apiculatus]|uniref:VWFA domain-containing protein n=1 Tax=Chondromyces apiculatus DSM 436 TaxID=1192034 RepID=A0A017SVU0_9BACT|nr:MopE-related protein [Chondromyces apiculatus]EYF00735.1 Hypothetical protein CAP_0303 [Chondromyces apiculatus DSM 436]